MTDQLFSKIKLHDSSYVYLGQPQKGTTSVDNSMYHYFKVYDNEYLDNQIGNIGFSLSLSLESIWSYKTDLTDGLFLRALKLSVPYIVLPFNIGEAPNMFDRSGYFLVIKLYEYDEISEDLDKLTIRIPGYTSPRHFVEQHALGGLVNNDAIKQFIIEYGTLESYTEQMQDGRFPTLNLSDDLLLDERRVFRAYNELENEYKLEPIGKKTLDGGYPVWSKITPTGKAITDNSLGTEMSTQTVEKAQKTVNPDSYSLTDEYVTSDLLSSIRALDGVKFDTKKLVAMLNELNFNVGANNVHSAHALVRSIIDHIPPIFNKKNFSEVASNYSWPKSDKEKVEGLQKIFRPDADLSLHQKISVKDQTRDMYSIKLHRSTLNAILSETIDLLK